MKFVNSIEVAAISGTIFVDVPIREIRDRTIQELLKKAVEFDERNMKRFLTKYERHFRKYISTALQTAFRAPAIPIDKSHPYEMQIDLIGSSNDVLRIFARYEVYLDIPMNAKLRV